MGPSVLTDFLSKKKKKKILLLQYPLSSRNNLLARVKHKNLPTDRSSHALWIIPSGDLLKVGGGNRIAMEGRK